MRPRSLVTGTACAFLLASVALAQSATEPSPAPRLGSLSFPNSGASAAQPDFIRGVLWMHSFEYAKAAESFRSAEAKDPAFALAYWGEAMTHTHPIWNEQNLAAARAALAKLGATPAARAAKAPTPRERDYLAAVEALYGEGAKPARDTIYARSMERLAAANPDDVEAQAFYALSLMGLSQGVRVVNTYMRAGAIAEELFERHPDHPGAAHYVIHAFDDPTHAPLGLRAARAYSRIAPSAGHAQHMTTHIFLALGLWPDVVSQNEVAQRAVVGGTDRTNWFAGHYTSWYGYGLLQEGRFDDARANLALLWRNQPRSKRGDKVTSLLWMRAAYLVETERWTDSVMTWPVSTPGTTIDDLAPDLFVRGVAALRTGRRAEALAVSRELDRATGTGGTATDPLSRVSAAQLRALIAVEAGKPDSAIALLRRTATWEDTLPVDFGPPAVVKPTHELLAEILLARSRAADAQREFTLALQRAPRRLRSLAGLARAARAAGDTPTADDARRTLRASLAEADAGLLEKLLAAQ